MGFTLRATLDLLPRDAIVSVTELVPAVVEWNRGPLGPLAEHPLKDKRVRLEVGDVGDTLRSGRSQFDAVLLDVDNGPTAFTTPENSRLYDDSGLSAIRLTISGLRTPPAERPRKTSASAMMSASLRASVLCA